MFEETFTICEQDSILIFGNYEKTPRVFYDNLTTISGCDSIYKITLIVATPVEITRDTTICSNDIIFLGGEYQNSAGVYYDTLTSYLGCDSIIETTLTVNLSYVINLTESICINDSIFLGGEYQTTQGFYYDTLSSVNGCDSIIVTNLSILPLPMVDIGPDTLFACDGKTLVFNAYDPDFISYNWIDFTHDSAQEFVYSSTQPKSVQIVEVTGSNGCTNQDRVFIVDNSLFNLFHNLPVINGPTVNLSLNTMPDNADGWYWSFGDGDTLSGNTTPSHSYGVTGTYEACLIAYNECETDSQCWTVQIMVETSVNSLGENEYISIYPNPTTGILYLELHNPSKAEIGIQLMNTLGKKLEEFTSYGEKVELDLMNYPKGIYFIKINRKNSATSYKVFYR